MEVHSSTRREWTRMTSTAPSNGVLFPPGSNERVALELLVAPVTKGGAAAVFVVGLPGMGKSLLTHQLVHLAAARGRRCRTLQWDVARPAFEYHPSAAQFRPSPEGETHPCVRLAVGLWCRDVVAKCCAQYPADLLVGELPVIGNRFVELLVPHREDPKAETFLSSKSVLFMLPVPSDAVRNHITQTRVQRMQNPLHPNEREDCPPSIMVRHWNELQQLESKLKLQTPAAATSTPPTAAISSASNTHAASTTATTSSSPLSQYDAVQYERVFRHFLRFRTCRVLPLTTLLPTEKFTVYGYTAEKIDLIPQPEEIIACLKKAHALYPTDEAAAAACDRWWQF